MKEHEERMAFRLPAAEAEQIRASASALGVSVSEWLRVATRERYCRLTGAGWPDEGLPLEPLGAEFTAAIFSDVEGLYDND